MFFGCYFFSIIIFNFITYNKIIQFNFFKTDYVSKSDFNNNLLEYISNNSPLEQFEIINLFSIQFPIFGYFTLTVTNLAFYSIIILIVTLGLHILGNNESKLIPSKWSIALESIYSTISTIVKDQIGSHNERYFPFIYSLFFLF